MKLEEYILNYIRLMVSGFICLCFFHWGWSLRDYGFDLYQYYGMPCLALLVLAPLLLLFFSRFLLFVKDRFYDQDDASCIRFFARGSSSMIYEFFLVFGGFVFGANWTDDPDIAEMLLVHPPFEDPLFYVFLFVVLIFLIHGIFALFSFFKKRFIDKKNNNDNNGNVNGDSGDLAE